MVRVCVWLRGARDGCATYGLLMHMTLRCIFTGRTTRDIETKDKCICISRTQRDALRLGCAYSYAMDTSSHQILVAVSMAISGEGSVSTCLGLRPMEFEAHVCAECTPCR